MNEQAFIKSFVIEFNQQRFHLDMVLIGVVISLLSIGYVMMTSASLHLGNEIQLSMNLSHAAKQLIHIIAGLVLAGVIATLPLSWWRQCAPWMMLGGLSLLVMVLIPGLGEESHGATRWLSIAGQRFQVSEPFKLSIIVTMAAFIAGHPEKVNGSIFEFVRINRWESIPKTVLSPYGILLLCCGLLIAERNFGATAVVVAVTMGMLFLAGMRLGVFIMAIFMSVIALVMLVIFEPYRLQRITAYLDPYANAEGGGYQIIQALIAYVNGGWLGTGLGSGVQKMHYLPEGHTDFLFAVLGEELGFIGVLLVVCLYGLLVLRLFRTAVLATRQYDVFGAMICYGIALWLGLQAFINMGVNLGILPPKGLTLPLMSYGGTSIMVTLMALGLVCRIFHENAANQDVSLLERNSQWQTQS